MRLQFDLGGGTKHLNIKIMTVQELIDELSKVKNKHQTVCLSLDYGEQENGDPIDVEFITEHQDCITINN